MNRYRTGRLSNSWKHRHTLVYPWQTLIYICLLIILLNSCSIPPAPTVSHESRMATTAVPSRLIATLTTTPTTTRACPIPSPTATPILPTATDPPATLNPSDIGMTTSESLISLSIFNPQAGYGRPNLDQMVELELQSVPILRIVNWSSDGHAMGGMISPWTDSPVMEMRYCVSVDQPCQLDATWQPFTVSERSSFVGGSRQTFPVVVDWIGVRTIWLVAEFRDAQGQPVLSAAYDEHNPQPPQAQAQVPFELIGMRDESIPVDKLSGAVQTSLAITEVAHQANLAVFPVIGSVLIEGGRGATGGIAGNQINIHVDFSATSPFGKVTEMRILPYMACGSGQVESFDAPWEPYTPSRDYPYVPPINWIGWYIAVQYRDELGNLSLIYCADISVEGMPPTSSPSPTLPVNQIKCITPQEVRPGPGETINCGNVLFSWPGVNSLPASFSYRVIVMTASDNQLVADGITQDTSLILKPSVQNQELVWYLTVAETLDPLGNPLYPLICSSFPSDQFNLFPPQNIQGIHFLYTP